MSDYEKLFNSSWEIIWDSTVVKMSDFCINKKDIDDFDTILISVKELFYHSINNILSVKKVIDEKNLFEVIDDCVDLFYNSVDKFSDEHTLIKI